MVLYISENVSSVYNTLSMDAVSCKHPVICWAQTIYNCEETVRALGSIKF